jgi:hypothetical protein
LLVVSLNISQTVVTDPESTSFALIRIRYQIKPEKIPSFDTQ